MRPGPAAALALLLAAVPTLAAEPELATPPTLRQLVPAEVPPGTAFPAPEVAVVLSIDVAADGRVERVAVEQGAGEPFDSAALAAARRFEFEPGRLASGEAVPVTVTFRLRIREPPPPPAPVKIVGRLLERGTRRPLEDVPVSATAGEQVLGSAATDPAGRFTLAVPAEAFALSASPPGHRPLQVSIQARPGEEREEVYYLESVGGANETVVSASAIRREVIREVIPADLVRQLPGTAGDTLKAVQNLPGVARAPFGGGALILRGSNPGDSQVFLDGQQIPLLYHFGGLRSTFNSVFLQSVEFVPGNFASDYGRAQGGIIDVRARDPAADGFHGEVDLNLYDAGVALEGPLGGGWSLGGAFHRSWVDALLPAVLPSDANLSFNTAPRYYDYQFLSTYRPNERHTLRFLFYGSMDRVAALFDQPRDDPTITGAFDARVMFHSLQVNYASVLSRAVRQETSLRLGLQQIDTQVGPQYFFTLKARLFSLRSAWTWVLSPVVEARGGLDIVVNGASVALNLPQSSGTEAVPPSTLPQVGADTRVTLYQPAAFAELLVTPLPGLGILPGLRADWYSDIRSWSVDPRLNLRYQATPSTVLKGGIGLYSQPPSPAESAAQTGNPALLPERSLQASLGAEQRILSALDLSVTAFYKWLDRQVVPNQASVYDPAAPRYTNEGTGRVYGIEALLKASFTNRFTGWIAFTWQRSLRTDPGQPERPSDFDQPVNLTALGIYQLGRGWSAGARFRYVSGNPSTPVTGSIYDSATDVYVPLYGTKNSERLGAFYALDLRIDKVWTFDTWKLDLYLDVQNVTNHGNQEGWTYSYNYAQRTPMTGLPILPILGIRGNW